MVVPNLLKIVDTYKTVLKTHSNRAPGIRIAAHFMAIHCDTNISIFVCGHSLNEIYAPKRVFVFERLLTVFNTMKNALK